MRIVVLVVLSMQVGCGTIANLAEGPAVYGGVRHDTRPMELLAAGFAAWDIPFSAVLDTALLPITGLFELVRWLSGWPPSPDFETFRTTWP